MLKRLMIILYVLIFALICFATVSYFDSGKNQGRQLLEQSIRRACVTCYANEGAYPPNFKYIEDNYYIHVDDDYYVYYDCFASNLMPEIDVFEK